MPWDDVFIGVAEIFQQIRKVFGLHGCREAGKSDKSEKRIARYLRCDLASSCLRLVIALIAPAAGGRKA